MDTYLYNHPELEPPLWVVKASTVQRAHQAFEDCWQLRVAQGLLEHVDGNFWDGELTESPIPLEGNLCSHSLGGHWWEEDERPERLEHVNDVLQRMAKPMVCILCTGTEWRPKAAPSAPSP